MTSETEYLTKLLDLAEEIKKELETSKREEQPKIVGRYFREEVNSWSDLNQEIGIKDIQHMLRQSLASFKLGAAISSFLSQANKMAQNVLMEVLERLLNENIDLKRKIISREEISKLNETGYIG